MMRDHTVAVDSMTNPPRLEFAANFNVSVPFIDRHLEEGRSDKTVIQMTDGSAVSYGQLARRVNRTGNALLDCGIAPGDRVIMIVKDCPEFYYLFWGAIKAGIVPVPVNTLLRSTDYAFVLEDSGCTACVYSPDYAAEVEPVNRGNGVVT